jgi:hypothetical protein
MQISPCDITAYGHNGGAMPCILNPALDGDEWSVHASAKIYPVPTSDPRARLDSVLKRIIPASTGNRHKYFKMLGLADHSPPASAEVKKILIHEGEWGSGRIDPYFLDLGTSWR